MAVTPHFNDEKDVGAGGWWTDYYGRRICTWSYDPTSRELSVRCGSKGKRVQRPANVASTANLKGQLARSALELAETIEGKKYDF